MITRFQPGVGLAPAWRVDFFDDHAGIPRLLIVTGLETRPLHLDIRLSNAMLSSLPTELFEESVLPASRRISLDAIDIQRLWVP